VVVRGTVGAERLPGGFGGLYPVLAGGEDTGRVRRGYFVETLGGAQFAEPGAVEKLRAVAAELAAGDKPRRAVVLAATDPANPYGAALPWPDRPAAGERADGDPPDDLTDLAGPAPAVQAAPAVQNPAEAPTRSRGHQPGRKAGALVVLVAGALTLYLERGGRSLLTFTRDEGTLALGTAALAETVRSGLTGGLLVERVDGTAVGRTGLAGLLEGAGFRPTPRGLRLRL
jgi:ATP-dependent Lhr-like helicase